MAYVAGGVGCIRSQPLLPIVWLQAAARPRVAHAGHASPLPTLQGDERCLRARQAVTAELNLRPHPYELHVCEMVRFTVAENVGCLVSAQVILRCGARVG